MGDFSRTRQSFRRGTRFTCVTGTEVQVLTYVLRHRWLLLRTTPSWCRRRSCLAAPCRTMTYPSISSQRRSTFFAPAGKKNI
jgi:hypothetical protein